MHKCLTYALASLSCTPALQQLAARLVHSGDSDTLVTFFTTPSFCVRIKGGLLRNLDTDELHLVARLRYAVSESSDAVC